MSQLKDRVASMVFAFDDADRQDAVRAFARDVGAMEARLAALEAQNKAMRDRLAEEDTVKNAALNCLREATAAVLRLAPLEAEAKQAREDEAWALDAAVTIHPDGASKSFAPMFWSVRYWDGVRTLEVTAPTIHAALRPLRAKVEGGAR